MAAKTFFWVGGDATPDFENPVGTNWEEENGTAAGAGVYPGSAFADSIVFDGRAKCAPSVKLNQSANANGIVNLEVRDGYAFGLGTQEDPFYIKAAGAGVWTFNGQDHGELFIIGGTAAVADVRILKTPAPTTDVPAWLHLVFGGVIATLAQVIGGAVRFEKSLFGVTSLGITTFNVGQGPSGSEPVWYLHAPVTTLNRWAGQGWWNDGLIGTLNGYGGTLRRDQTLAALTVTTPKNYGGTMDFRCGVPGRTTLTNPILVAGGEVLFDFGESLQRS